MGVFRYVLTGVMTVMCQSRPYKLAMAGVWLGMTGASIYYEEKAKGTLAITGALACFLFSEKKLLKGHFNFATNMEVPIALARDPCHTHPVTTYAECIAMCVCVTH